MRKELGNPAEPNAETEPDHEHYWVDAPDDETAWHCTICGTTEYPEHAFQSEEDALVASQTTGKCPGCGEEHLHMGGCDRGCAESV